ncbi:MAG: vWA domain-containing protein [Blastocatellia bacterium]
MLRKTILLFSILATCGLFAAGQALPEPVKPDVPVNVVSYGLVVDNSGSYRLLLERIIRLSNEVIDTNQPMDEAFFATFVDTGKIVVRQDLTNDKSILRDASENMFIEGGQTAILDAVRFSADFLSANVKGEGRAKALVLITDGDERLSAAKIDDVIRILKNSNIKVFAFGIAEQKVITKVIDRLTKETGGKTYLPKTREETSAAIKDLAVEIRKK